MDFSGKISQLPSITIITCILNCHIPTFKQCLESIKHQRYPKKLIEHLVMDGGSTNEGPKLSKKYDCHVIVREDLKNRGEARVGIAIKQAKNDLILMLQSDNILISNDWLLKMVKPFIDNKNVFCAFSIYNSYYKNMDAITRYCALFGAQDPLLYYLGKTEKIRRDQHEYNKGDILEKNSDYYILKFNKYNLPPLGDNGHMFLKSAIRRVNKVPEKYLHTDAFSNLLQLEYDTLAAINNSVIHVQEENLFDYIKKRVLNKTTFYDSNRGKRKYFVFNWNSRRDKLNLIKYIFYSVTFIIPLFQSIRGYTKVKDIAWFLHPILCLEILCGYGLSEVNWFFRRVKLFLFEATFYR